MFCAISSNAWGSRWRKARSSSSPPDFAHAQAVRDGRINLDGLGGHVRAPLRTEITERTHVVQAVGQLHDDHPNIIDHGQQHLAETRLAFLGAVDIQLAELGDAHPRSAPLRRRSPCGFRRASCGYLRLSRAAARFRCGEIHAHAGHDVRHHERMPHVGLAGLAQLAFVQPGRDAEGFMLDDLISKHKKLGNRLRPIRPVVAVFLALNLLLVGDSGHVRGQCAVPTPRSRPAAAVAAANLND